jgi:hypothetical protein
MLTYRHAGDAGDIIASLPVVRHFGRGDFLIEASTYTRQALTPDKWCGLDLLLKQQPYINDVREWRREMVTINLNDFRARLFKAIRVGQSKDKSLVDWCLEAHGLPLNLKDTAWLTVDQPVKAAKVVFNRTGPGREPHHVYHNLMFPWHRVWQKYHENAVFIGTSLEHASFCAQIGPVPHQPTSNLLEAARVIAGADLFVGNQSCCFWIAEAMKKKLVLEVWPQGPNSNVFRDGATQGFDQNVWLPEI